MRSMSGSKARDAILAVCPHQRLSALCGDGPHGAGTRDQQRADRESRRCRCLGCFCCARLAWLAWRFWAWRLAWCRFGTERRQAGTRKNSKCRWKPATRHQVLQGVQLPALARPGPKNFSHVHVPYKRHVLKACETSGAFAGSSFSCSCYVPAVVVVVGITGLANVMLPVPVPNHYRRCSSCQGSTISHSCCCHLLQLATATL